MCEPSRPVSDSFAASSPDFRPHPGALRRVTLLCPEPLRASACCVEDALIARGWRVRLEFGAQARRVLLRTRRDGPRELRVLCVSEPLDAEVEAQLRLGVDPDGRGDFQIVQFHTPRAVIEAVERLGGAQPRRRRLAPRRGRTYLQHATLVEQQVHDDRTRRFGIATALAVAIAAVVAIDPRPDQAEAVVPVARHIDDARDAGTETPRFDDPVLASTRAAIPPDEEDDLEPPIVIEDDDSLNDSTTARDDAVTSMSAAPLERKITVASEPPSPQVATLALPPAVGLVTPPSPADLSRRRATYTVDPFATVDP